MNEDDATRGARSGSRLVILGSQQTGAPVADTGRAGTEELTEADLREARRVFEIKLRGRVRPQWVAEHAEDLFAKAQQQYAEWLAAGRVADTPRAWLVHTAWRRAQDQLDYEKRRGQSVPIEDVAYAVADEKTPTPEQVLLEGDRRAQLLDALGDLKPDHRELLKLVYFDNLEVREAGELLGWTPANASYHHKAVLKRLRKVLDGNIEVPEIGSGAAAIVAIERFDAFSLSKLVELMGDAATAALHRMGELARRVLPASDPASASLAGSAARAAGVCGAAVATVCLATGVVGPGVGAIELADPAPERRSIREVLIEEPRPASDTVGSTGANAEPPDRAEKAGAGAAHAGERRRQVEAESHQAARASRRRTSRAARSPGEDQVNAEAAAEPAWSEPVQPHPMSEEESAGSEVQAPSGSGSGSARETSPATEFGL